MPDSGPLHTSAPYREPCDGWGRPLVSGPCYQHKRKSEETVTEFANVTKVDGVSPVTGDAAPADPCGEGEIRLPDRDADGNCFKESEETHDFSDCHKTGWKAVRSDKVWHGQLGYDYCPEDGCDKRTTKYLTKAATANIGLTIRQTSSPITGWDSTDVTASYANTWNETVEVDKDSGVRTVTACQKDSVVTGFSGVGDWFVHWIAGKLPFMENTFLGYLAKGKVECGGFIPSSWPEGSSCDATLFGSFIECWFLPCDEASAYLKPTPESIEACMEDWIGETSPNGGLSFTFGGLGMQTGVGLVETGYFSGHLTLDTCDVAFTDDRILIDIHLGFVKDSWTPLESLDPPPPEPTIATFSYNLTIDITLTDEYTLSDCFNDAAALLAEWDLSDDVQHPWRTDTLYARVPVVKREEVSTANQPTYDGECPGSLPLEIETNSGDIIGAPLPRGYGENPADPQGFFAFNMPNYNSSCTLVNYGVWTPPNIPHTATWWASQAEDGSHGLSCPATYPGGAFISLPRNYDSYAEPDVLHVQKFAWIKETHPSINFFRPCGADRDVLSDTDPCVSTQRYWDGSSATRPKAWPICGHVAIETAVEDSGTVTITLAEAAPYLEAGDYVTLVYYDDDTARTRHETDSARQVLTVNVGKTEFTYSGPAPDQDATHVISHIPAGSTTTMGAGPQDAPHYKWHDEDAKGDYILLEWTTDLCPDAPNPDPVETCTPDCIKRTPCWPSVICISPNARLPFGAVRVDDLGSVDDLGRVEGTPIDVFPNGTTYDMELPSNPNTFWQAVPVTELLDPFWREPLVCTEGAIENPCDENPTAPACIQPHVEPLCEKPDGAPTIPFKLPCPYTIPDDGICSPPANGQLGGTEDWV